ncbi:MAG TPA: nucleotide exchange factor GrpE [Candidatus Sulfotelmatobacter sp.]|nr:nucleotide exchange factor GrpE [Candidatus Sulfotelmatobacter sp.]
MNDGTDNQPPNEPDMTASQDPGGPADGDATQRLEALEADNAQLRDQLLRALADTENLRRRGEREREDTSKYAVATLARDILSVADNLRRALDALPADQAPDDATRNLLTGIEATERELLGIFERRGIKRIEPMGERFDPNFHQAMFEVANTGQPPGTVVQVLQPGYVIFDRLLRPALVGVAKAENGEARSHIDTRA